MTSVLPLDSEPDHPAEVADALIRAAASFAAQYPWDLSPEDVTRRTPTKRRSSRSTKRVLVTVTVAAGILVAFVLLSLPVRLFHLGTSPAGRTTAKTTGPPVSKRVPVLDPCGRYLVHPKSITLA